MHQEPWIRGLDTEDLAFVRRLVLASGSLKQVAAEYGVSYPTVRLRLDRLIAKIQVWESFQKRSPFERRLRGAFADGKLDADTFRTLLEEYQREEREPHVDLSEQ